MARALNADEKLRYPWASVITDYVPPGRLRRWGLWCGFGGLGYLLLGAVFLLFFTSSVAIDNGVPKNAAAAIVCYPAYAALAVGSILGLVTGVQAIVRNAKTALVWSLGAFLPGFLVFLILVVV